MGIWGLSYGGLKTSCEFNLVLNDDGYPQAEILNVIQKFDGFSIIWKYGSREQRRLFFFIDTR